MAQQENFREVTGRELLLSLSRLGGLLGNRTAMLADHLGINVNDLHRDPEEDDDDEVVDVDWDEPMAADQEDLRPCPIPSDAPSVPSCSYLMPGRTFTGHQRLTGPHRQHEDWAVTATLYSCDLAAGKVTGSMLAQNSPLARKAIVTYFEGDIIDNLNHTFFTGSKWGSCPSPDTDLRHWGRCPGFTAGLRAAAVANEGRARQLATAGHVFMRWKECFFVDVPQDCPLTISGYYYISLDRATGAIRGYYHDARSAPLQVLQLEPAESCGGGGGGRSGLESGAAEEPAGGMAFGAYRLC